MKLSAKPLSLAILGGMLAMAGPATADTIKLRILETTDIHTNVMDFDYYKDKPTKKTGLVRTATLVKQAQSEVTNSVLVDNGDLIQGSPMGDYMAAKGLNAGDIHPVYKAMNQLNYEVGNIGNHEFNYGLDFLDKAIAGANFPYVNANVYDLKTGKNLFTSLCDQITYLQRYRRCRTRSEDRLYRLCPTANHGMGQAPPGRQGQG